MRYGRTVRRSSRAGRKSWPARVLDVVVAVVILGLVAVIAAKQNGDEPQVVSGHARVSDGDSLVIQDARIRMEGIDAPELSQMCRREGSEWACGRQARDRLAALVGTAPVSCRSQRRDRYGRLLARCTAQGVDLARAMVEEGWAVAYGDHEDAEAAARRARRGIWSGTFERPQAWRQVHGGLVEDWHDGLFARLRAMWRDLVTD